MAITTELVSQAPVRNLAAVWTSGNKLVDCLPIVATAIVRRTYDADGWVENEFDFIAYRGESGCSPLKCRESFPLEKYEMPVVFACTSEQWAQLFRDDVSVSDVGKQLAADCGVTLHD